MALIVLLVLVYGFSGTSFVVQEDEIAIGFVGALTGPVAQYGSYEAVSLAVQEINALGGIDGKRVNLIAEDGACNPTSAASTARKLIFVDNVQFILGGHCSPESLAVAPLAEENKVLMLASITTSPYLSDKEDYVFRTSPSSVVQAELIARYAFSAKDVNSFSILYEQTDYAQPIAEKLQSEVISLDGRVDVFEGFAPGTKDFRSIISKAIDSGSDAIFISPQSPDAAFNLLKQITEMGFEGEVFGNDVSGNKAAFLKDPSLQDGLVIASPRFDQTSVGYSQFRELYSETYNVGDIPYGFWTAESYDAVYVLKEAIELAGEDPTLVKEYLYDLEGYDGVSGSIEFDQNGDGQRDYSLKVILDGEQIDL